ncbi:MAG: glycosyltransferase [Candidatus Methylophosphatis roskildensis]
MLDVIVPVYRDVKQTQLCLESVLGVPQVLDRELVVIDDATPEPELAAYLDHLAQSSLITLVRNDRNLGFVVSVNRGMSLHPDRDVVLLNSDTEVANDWLDRLHRCAYSQPNVGTVTPFSNSATICSYPFDGWQGGVPGTLGLSALDRLFAVQNAGRCLDLPTAVGFCMFVRRACIDHVGLFDEKLFGRGYGEENDFSLRAATAGWRSVLAADVFVFHAGSVSFGDERLMLKEGAMKSLLDVHPNYLKQLGEFSASDPVRPLRDAIDLARMATSKAERQHVRRERKESARRFATKPTQLHLTHSWDGGTNRWISDFCEHDGDRRNLVLRSVSNLNAAAWRLELLDPSEADVPLMAWDLEQPVHATDIYNLEYLSVLAEIVDVFDVRALLVSSLIGHSLDVFDFELPTVVLLHDLYPFCPALFACFDTPCTQCATDKLKSCMQRNPYNAFWHNTSVDDWLGLRDAYAQRLAPARVSIAAPSQSAWERWTKLYPEIAEKACRIIPHGIRPGLSPQVANASLRSRAPGGKLRLVVPGRLLPHKGLDLFAQALPDLSPHAEVLLLGCGKFGRPFENTPGVEIVKTYSHQELRRHVEAFRPDAALMLSVVPESFSYTLSEMFALGLPVIATNLGAFAERIEPGRNGLLFEPHPAALSDLVRKLAREPQLLTAMCGRVRNIPIRYVQDMIRAYHSLLPAGETQGVASCEDRARSRVAQRWIARGLRERQGLATGNRQLRHEAEQCAERLAYLEAHLREQHSRCVALEHQVARVEAENAAIFRSRSWRWAALLRGLSDGFRKLCRVGVLSKTVPVPKSNGDAASSESGARASAEFKFEPDKRGEARRTLREQIGAPDASRIVLSLVAGDHVAKICPVAGLARRVLAERNDTVFLCRRTSGDEGQYAEIESALLVATRKMLVLPDTVDLGMAIAGADVLLLDHPDSIRAYLPLIEMGTKLLVLGPDSSCGASAANGATRVVSVDALDRVPAIISDWFGESTRGNADTDDD